MAKKKLMLIISFGVLFLLTITLFFYLSTFIQPKITFNAQINKISEKDYQGIHPGISIEKIRNIHLQVKITTLFGIISHVHIENEQSKLFLLQQYLKDSDKILVLGGGSYSLGNGMEYDENTEISLKNISEDELRSILGNFRIKILWQDIWGNQNNKIYYFKDYLK